MVLDPSCCSIPSLQRRVPPDSSTTNLVLPSLTNLLSDGPVNAGPSPLISHNSDTSTTTRSQPTNDLLGSSHSPTSSQPFTTSSPMPSVVRTIFHFCCPINDIGSIRSSLPPSPSFTLSHL
ncbi:hypothetical protein P692DRAFT_20239778 [Suillus brevipes Sb2]|nr:hypothetical protein P692DRAFT_20239778 [Suillus brevipes Sb2]